MGTLDRSLSIALGVWLLAGMVPARGAEAARAYAAYVVLGQAAPGDTVALARTVLAGVDARCPEFRPEDPAASGVAMQARRNPDPVNFPITVCEALYPRGHGQWRIAGAPAPLPAVPEEVSRVTVFGDTDCSPRYQHGCSEGAGRSWPFGRMAAAAARGLPELILHMGDYNYRGTPGHIRIEGRKVRVYDAGDNSGSIDCRLEGPYHGQNSVGSDTPDTWSAWQGDFFDPAAPLLAAAPWVVARGNHELCSRAGTGWFYLLDTGSDLLGPAQPQLHCPAAESAEPLVFRAPYRIDLGGLSVLVLDSANACDRGTLHLEHYEAQFERMQALARNAPAGNALWLQSHRPLWGVRAAAPDTPRDRRDASGRYTYIDQTLQAAHAHNPLARGPHLLLSGHMHRFQVLSLDIDGATPGPTQLIVGNGGVSLAPNQPPQPFSLSLGGRQVAGLGLSAFGYMNLQLPRPGHWRGQLWSDEGVMLISCDSSHSRQPCTGVSSGE